MDDRAWYSGPHACRRCKAAFSTADKLIRHVAAEHPGVRRIKAAAAAGVTLVLVAGLLAWAVWPGPPVGPVEAFGITDAPYLGTPAAPNHLVVFATATCAECDDFHHGILPALVAGPVASGQLAVHFLSAPGDSDVDRSAAIAAQCAHRLGGTPAHLDLWGAFYQNRSRLDAQSLHEIIKDQAARHAIPEDTVMRCYYAEESLAALQAEWQIAQQHGVGPGLSLYLLRAGAVQKVQPDEVMGLLQA